MAAAAAARAREATPPPVIGRSGRYTVFITPPSAPRPADLPRTPVSPAPRPPPAPMPTPPPPAAAAVGTVKVQVPPQQFNKPAGRRASGSMFGFLRDAVAKVQDVHSSLDEYLADWLGLDQSKYQWALDDYYEAKGVEKEGGKPKEVVSKGVAV